MRGLKKKRFAFRDETNVAGGFATRVPPSARVNLFRVVTC